jgi:hypothetical protein
MIVTDELQNRVQNLIDYSKTMDNDFYTAKLEIIQTLINQTL